MTGKIASDSSLGLCVTSVRAGVEPDAADRATVLLDWVGVGLEAGPVGR